MKSPRFKSWESFASAYNILTSSVLTYSQFLPILWSFSCFLALPHAGKEIWSCLSPDRRRRGRCLIRDFFLLHWSSCHRIVSLVPPRRRTDGTLFGERWKMGIENFSQKTTTTTTTVLTRPSHFLPHDDHGQAGPPISIGAVRILRDKNGHKYNLYSSTQWV